MLIMPCTTRHSADSLRFLAQGTTRLFELRICRSAMAALVRHEAACDGTLCEFLDCDACACDGMDIAAHWILSGYDDDVIWSGLALSILSEEVAVAQEQQPDALTPDQAAFRDRARTVAEEMEAEGHFRD